MSKIKSSNKSILPYIKKIILEKILINFEEEKFYKI